MSKGQAMRKLRRPAGQDDGRSVQEKMTALIREAHEQQRHGFAERLVPRTAPNLIRADAHPNMLPANLIGLLQETHPQRRLSDLVLTPDTRAEMQEFLSEFVQAPLLRSHSMEPRHTILLVGPPGTGKSSLAGVLANELRLPFLTVRYDGLVGSYLGETAGRLQEIVDYASDTPCVLFFDEFESIGKERSDAHETGEIKRVVSSLLLHMDALPTHCVVICATNHPELLDRAVWRRFEIRVDLPLPGTDELKEWHMRAQRLLGDIGMTAAEFAGVFKGESLSEVEAVTLDARRKLILSKGASTPADAFGKALSRWNRRREIGGAPLGSKSNRKGPPRVPGARKAAGAEAEVPPRDLLSDAG